MRKITLVFSCIYFCWCYNLNAQNIERVNTCDTITKAQFWKMVKTSKQEMDERKDFSIDDCLNLIKIYNTLFLFEDSVNISKKKLIKGYQKIFEGVYWRFFNSKFKYSYSKYSDMFLTDFDITIRSRFSLLYGPISCKDMFTVL
jgi:hypothetical protein